MRRQLGRSRKEINDAIHKLREDLPGGTDIRNPGLYIDETGEAFPLGPGGTLRDSVGNIHEFL